MTRSLIIDGHLDLAMNAMEWNRDLRLPVHVIREMEEGLNDKPDRGRGMVSLPQLRKARVGIVVATQIARYVEKGSRLPGWNSPHQAWAQTQAQLAWYKAMEDSGEMKQLCSSIDLNIHIQLWEDETIDDNVKPIGYILSLEGADSLVDLGYLEKAYGYGLRALGPAHYGPGRYCPGTGESGPFTKKGLELLEEMDRLHMILDVTHLTDEAFYQAMNKYKGPVWASHHNCRSLVPNQRQLTDEQIKILIDRNSVIGGVLDAWMLVKDWERGISNPKGRNVTLQTLVDHFDHICQLAGNADHIAIGTDLDGAFGTEQAPFDIDTIEDLPQLGTILNARGYSNEEVEKILSGNWWRFLGRSI